jgi:hypothetical protein
LAKVALRETGARDISSSTEANSNDTSGGHATFGNISEKAPLSTHPLDRERIVSDRDVVDDTPVSARH